MKIISSSASLPSSKVTLRSSIENTCTFAASLPYITSVEVRRACFIGLLGGVVFIVSVCAWMG